MLTPQPLASVVSTVVCLVFRVLARELKEKEGTEGRFRNLTEERFFQVIIAVADLRFPPREALAQATLLWPLPSSGLSRQKAKRGEMVV